MAGKYLLRALILQVGIFTVNCQFDLLFGGGLGLGGGLGGNGGFGLGGSGGSGGGGFGMGLARPFFRSSALNTAVRHIVHPDATPTQAMLDIAYRQRGPPETAAQLNEYIPHFAQLALDKGVTHPNVTGVPTFTQMEEYMAHKYNAYINPSAILGQTRNTVSPSGSGSNAEASNSSSSNLSTDMILKISITNSTQEGANSSSSGLVAASSTGISNEQIANAETSGNSTYVLQDQTQTGSGYAESNTAANDQFLDQMMLFQILMNNNNLNIF